ncbi:MAG: lytic transglycosylase domain-containing protein/transglycosylase SLT domain-containing protein [Treponematales bacterium]
MEGLILALCIRIIENERLLVPPRLMFALIRQESGLESGAIGDAGEIGLCQIKPETARFVAATYEIDTAKGLFDAETNTTIGAYYLHYLYLRYGDGHDWVTPLICYNSGDMWLKSGNQPRKRAVAYAHKVVDGRTDGE